jgi:predicted aspartyl protease
MWPYNRQFDPPAPSLDIAVRHPLRPDQLRRIVAKLDTGADVSAIPQSVAADLELLPAQTITVEGFDGTRTSIDTYAVTIELAGARFRYIEVILIPDNYALIGRDILNHFYAHLHGPELAFDLLLSR